MTREAPRVSVRVVPGDEREIPEAHALAGEVRAEGAVEARVDRGPDGAEPERVGLNPWGVDPGAAHLVGSLEDHHAETLAPELSGRYETGGSSTDHGHVAGREWHGQVSYCCRSCSWDWQFHWDRKKGSQSQNEYK